MPETKYPPTGGIPYSDLSPALKASIDRANKAAQSVNGIFPDPSGDARVPLGINAHIEGTVIVIK